MLWREENDICKCGHIEPDHYEGKCHGWKAEGVINCSCSKWRPKKGLFCFGKIDHSSLQWSRIQILTKIKKVSRSITETLPKWLPRA